MKPAKFTLTWTDANGTCRQKHRPMSRWGVLAQLHQILRTQHRSGKHAVLVTINRSAGTP